MLSLTSCHITTFIFVFDSSRASNLPRTGRIFFAATESYGNISLVIFCSILLCFKTLTVRHRCPVVTSSPLVSKSVNGLLSDAPMLGINRFHDASRFNITAIRWGVILGVGVWFYFHSHPKRLLASTALRKTIQPFMASPTLFCWTTKTWPRFTAAVTVFVRSILRQQESCSYQLLVLHEGSVALFRQPCWPVKGSSRFPWRI